MLLHRSSSLPQTPCKLLSIFLFSSQSSSPNPKPPPRKGRQSVRRILKLLSSQNPNLSQTLKTLETSPQSLSSSQASTLISAISNPLISFDFFRFLKSMKPVFKPDSILYTSLIKSQLLSVNPKLYKVQFYFNEMKKDRVLLSGEDFRSLFALVVSVSREIAEFLVREVLEKGEFDEGSYSYAVTVYGNFGLFNEAILISERARVRLGKVSLEISKRVMGVYRLSGDARAAMELFLEMEESGTVVDEGFYRVLLEILYGVGWVKHCWIILEEMMQIGYKIDEDLALDLVRVFVREEMVSEAAHLFKERVLKGDRSLVVFVEAIVEKANPLVAFEIVKSMWESGLSVDGCVYASMLDGCGKMGLIEDAEKIFAQIKSVEGIKNRELAYSSMIHVYLKGEMRRTEETILSEIEVTPDQTGV